MEMKEEKLKTKLGIMNLYSKKTKILISSCLFGQNVRYDGITKGLDNNLLEKLAKKFELIPFCPEVESGLSIPRIACEIISIKPLKIINKIGEEKTKNFIDGANLTLELCQKENIKIALLKANSPSCSSKQIYDGCFSGKKIAGYGVTAELLKNNNIKIYDENDIFLLLD